ncbi:hypothetical protein BZG36_00687 [Bifiguratus adelaidae]|uniref:Uncharacterized protein n=1 Tax=Bifiguratus adelaidae TaxID=1938954 RepID=A0A261Y6T3_9FUNG|nr:hypothetical protein BZG36_00687 [Bifiguratus adelaidae]
MPPSQAIPLTTANFTNDSISTTLGKRPREVETSSSSVIGPDDSRYDPAQRQQASRVITECEYGSNCLREQNSAASSTARSAGTESQLACTTFDTNDTINIDQAIPNMNTSIAWNNVPSSQSSAASTPRSEIADPHTERHPVESHSKLEVMDSGPEDQNLSSYHHSQTTDLLFPADPREGDPDVDTVPPPNFTLWEVPSQCLTNPIHLDGDSEDDAPIYLLTASQYALLTSSYLSTPLPSNILFPWLHGVDGKNYQQNLFFGVRRCDVPKHRGLTIVYAGPENASATCNPAPTLDSPLSMSGSQIAPGKASTRKAQYGRLVGSVPLQQVLTSDLVNLLSDTLHSIALDGPVFTDTLTHEQGINLRNFRVQVGRYATISDIVVYGADELQDRASTADNTERRNEENDVELLKDYPHLSPVTLNIAKDVRKAQRKLYEKRDRDGSFGEGLFRGSGLRYRTFILTDPISKLQKEHPETVAITTDNVPINYVNFWEQEREEMRILTQAGQVTEGFWLGNTQDVPTPNDVMLGTAQSSPTEEVHLSQESDKMEILDNPQQFSICLEAHDLADMPTSSTLTLARETLNELPEGAIQQELIHLDVFASGSQILHPLQLEQFFTSLHIIFEFLADQITRMRRILLHCADGYTETSLFALCWVMWRERIRLPEAYLWIQQRRSFFVYGGDVEILRKVESWIFENYTVQSEKDEAISATVTRSNSKPLDEHQVQGLDVAQNEEPTSARLREKTTDSGVVVDVDPYTSVKRGNSMHLTVDDMSDDDGDSAMADPSSNPADGAQYFPTAESKISKDDDDEEDDSMGDLAPLQEGAPPDKRRLFDDAYISLVPQELAANPSAAVVTIQDPEASGAISAVVTGSVHKPSIETDNRTSYGSPASNHSSDNEGDGEDDTDDAMMEELNEFISAADIPVVPATEHLPTATQMRTPPPPLSAFEAESREMYPWFYSPRFEGSFPSRILPFLYLGNLNHATNPGMLRELGITHVLSVGENANVEKEQDFQLLFLDNLYDDGIDSLWNFIDQCINFVESARQSGGKCLIHCRVGVSRSATITIAYVMHHLRLPLVHAYLFVRARRLNVIIQPNLKFMYELLQYEQRLGGGRARVYWGTLSNQIHNLNMWYREG